MPHQPVSELQAPKPEVESGLQTFLPSLWAPLRLLLWTLPARKMGAKYSIQQCRALHRASDPGSLSKKGLWSHILSTLARAPPSSHDQIYHCSPNQGQRGTSPSSFYRGGQRLTGFVPFTFLQVGPHQLVSELCTSKVQEG